MAVQDRTSGFRLKCACIAAGISVLAAACSGGSGSTKASSAAHTSSSKPTGTVNFAIESLPSDWAPWVDNLGGITLQVYETLVQQNPKTGDIVPWLANSWTQTPTSLTLHLRHNILFQDGTPFNAAAVRVNIEGIEHNQGVLSQDFGDVSAVDVVNNYTVKFVLSHPDPSLLFTLASRGAYMGSPKAIADGSIHKIPVGTGAWEYDAAASTRGSREVMTYFPKYWDPSSVHIARINNILIPDANARLLALKSGQVDISDISTPSSAKSAGLPVIAYSSIHYQFVIFKQTGPLANVKVRQAMCYALNNTGNASVLGPDFITATPQRFVQGQYGYVAGLPGYTYNVAKAKQLMKEAGNPPINVTMAVFTDNQSIAEAIATQLKAVGINLKLISEPDTEYFTNWKTGKFEVGEGDVHAYNPYDYYNALFAPNGSANPFHTAYPTITADANKAIQAGNPAPAQPFWNQMFHTVYQQAPTCGYLQINSFTSYNPSKVSGVIGVIDDPTATDWHLIKVKG